MKERFANIRAQLRWVAEEYKLGHLAALLSFLAVIWFLAAVCIWTAERSPNRQPPLQPGDRFTSLTDCLWCSTVYLVSGLEEFEPATTSAKVAAVGVMTKSFPKAETYSLTDQGRRSSRSVGAQIAEAWAKRRYPNHFKAFRRGW